MFANLERRGAYHMPPPNGTADYTPALIAAMSDHTANGEFWFPPGEYYFYGPLPTSEYPELFNAFKWFAAPTAATRQHRVEPGNSHDMRRSVQFKIYLSNESAIWLSLAREYRLGPISITGGIALTLTYKGNLISIGDPAENSASYVSIRGLKLECDLDREMHYASIDVDGEGNKWLEDKGANGFVLNRPNQSFGLRMSHCYDVQLDVNTRGLKYGVINIRCDRPRGSVIGLSNGRTLVETNMQGVASQWTNVWEENSMIGSIVAGHVADFRGETNPMDSTPPGAYALPSAVTWDIVEGGTAINFYSWAGGYDARDYFEPWTVIKVTPDDAQEPSRYLLVTTVAANSVSFFDPASKSYVPRPIEGTGDRITRYFGIPLTCLGSRCDIASRSTGENFLSIPDCAIVPGGTPLRVAGNSNGRGWDANSAQLPIIVASCVGAQEQVFGGVDILGTADVPSHPLVNSSDAGPRFERRTREAFYDYPTNTITAVPGRGVSSINNCSLNLLFRTAQEENGQIVNVYNPLDAGATYGWEVRDPRLRKTRNTAVIARVFNPNGGTIVIFCQGENTGGVNANAVPGWSTVSFTMPSAAMDGDIDSAFVRLTNVSSMQFSVSWVKINQT